MKNKSLVVALALAISSTSSFGAVQWIDWANPSSGSLTIGSNTVGVTLSGSAPLGMSYDGYYYNSYPATYGGLSPHDLIQVNSPSTFTLLFNTPIVDPYVAFVSVGQGGWPVTYTFNGPIVNDISHGPNFWGYTGYQINGNSITGWEYNGVVQLQGIYGSLTVSTSPNEYWHGFNVGAETVTTPVPEPETFAMLLAGLGLLSFTARRRKQR